MDVEGNSRRNFFYMLGALATISTIGGFTAAVGRFMTPNVLYEPPKAYKIGRAGDYPQGVNFLPDKRIYIIRRESQIQVVSAVCTHIGCTTRWNAEGEQWECPCHGSTFDARGTVLKGPAPRPLPWYHISQTADGRLFIDQGRTVSFNAKVTVSV